MGGIVTVHDYSAAIHPWLLSLRDELLVAAGSQSWSDPLPPATKLMVDIGLDVLSIKKKEECMLGGTATTSSPAAKASTPSETAISVSASNHSNAGPRREPPYPTYEELLRQQKEHIPTEQFLSNFTFMQGVINPPTLVRQRVTFPSLVIPSIRRFPEC